ncbi:MAG: response regulator, partial [Bdellovibrionales bacterium]|nr:response regulator [Bdellovibrionales bacterium]
TEDPRTKDNPLVLGKPKIRFYAGAPLVDSQGFALGTLCIIDFSPRSMTEEEGRRLEVLARQVCVQLELHRRIRQADALIREIEEQRKATEGALRARSTFLASMSHEIRTPITTILGLVEIITRDNKTGPFDSRQAAEAIFANSKYLLEYMNCVLDLSKAESTNLPVEAAEVSIFHILQEVQGVLLLKAKEKELNLFVNFRYPLPERISTDPSKLKHILFHLVSNAIKSSVSGDVTTEIWHKRDTNELFGTVHGSGPPLSSEEMEQINEESGELDGLDYRLATTKQILHELGGTLLAEPSLTRGTKLTFSIPLLPIADIQFVSENPSLKKQENGDEIPISLHGKALLVEDEAINRKLVSHILERIGLEVDTAADGVEAVEKAESTQFDLILLDMQLPKLNGVLAAKQMKEKNVTAPIIALTATQNEQDFQELLYAGCVEYVPKPFDRHTLLSCLKRYLHQQGESSALGFELDSGLIGSEGFSELILNYVKGLSGRLERIHTALEQTDWAKLREEAHKLNAAGLFGLHRISDVSKLLEEQALRHEAFSCRELTDRLANEISSATEHVPEEIKRQIQEHKSS